MGQFAVQGIFLQDGFIGIIPRKILNPLIVRDDQRRLCEDFFKAGDEQLKALQTAFIEAVELLIALGADFEQPDFTQYRVIA